MYLVHNGQRDHKCNPCEKLFSQAVDLKRHIDYNGKKYHKCDLCEKAFSSSGWLKKHVNAIHKCEKHYKCNICYVIDYSLGKEI